MKKIFLAILIIFFCSCTKKINYDCKVKTIIEESPNTLIAINYPITPINNINKQIKKYVNNEYKNFLKNYNQISYLNQKYELNIDYTCYSIENKYISINIYKRINSLDNSININEIYNLVYDIEKKKKISFNDILNNNKKYIKDLIKSLLLENYGNHINISKLSNINYKEINFIITDDSVNIYFEGNKLCDKYNEILNISIPNTYFNSLKNITSKEIEPTINITPTINYIDISKPVVALTFDDGPSIYTKEILNTLKENNSNATFFVLGNKIENHSEIIKEMYKNGNEIGNHSYNHRWLTRLSKLEQIDQIEKTQQLIYNYTGFTPKYLRPTYGSINKNLRNNINLEIILWTIDTKDWKYKNTDTIVNNAIKNIKDGSIILMHDTYKRTSDAVKILVPKLIENGYQLVTISELKEIKKIKNKINEK